MYFASGNYILLCMILAHALSNGRIMHTNSQVCYDIKCWVEILCIKKHNKNDDQGSIDKSNNQRIIID